MRLLKFFLNSLYKVQKLFAENLILPKPKFIINFFHLALFSVATALRFFHGVRFKRVVVPFGLSERFLGLYIFTTSGTGTCRSFPRNDYGFLWQLTQDGGRRPVSFAIQILAHDVFHGIQTAPTPHHRPYQKLVTE